MKKICSLLLCALLLITVSSSIANTKAKPAVKAQKDFKLLVSKSKRDNDWYAVWAFVHLVSASSGLYHYSIVCKIGLENTSCDACIPGSWLAQPFGQDYQITYDLDSGQPNAQTYTFDIPSMATSSNTKDVYMNHALSATDVTGFSQTLSGYNGLPVGPSGYFITD